MFEQVAVAPQSTGRRVGPGVGRPVPLDTVSACGTYVCNWSGHLLRVPERSLRPDGSLGVNIVGGEPLTVTKISDDPDVPLHAARGLAWGFGLRIRF